MESADQRTTEVLVADGGPQGARERVDALRERDAAVHATRRTAATAERTLEGSGIAGAGGQRAGKLLGRRDELEQPDQRRYDSSRAGSRSRTSSPASPATRAGTR